MGLKFVAVSAEQARETFGGQVRTSKMRDAVTSLANEVRDFFADNPEAAQLWTQFEVGNADACVGVRWMDLSDDLQDACKREKGGGMSAIVSNINRNFRESHKISARLVKQGDDATSGEIYFTRYTPKSKSGTFPKTEAERLDNE
jgi:hypothetical protein